MKGISKIRQSKLALRFFKTEVACQPNQSSIGHVAQDVSRFVFGTALVSDGVPDIICVAQITLKFVDHPLIVDNRELLLFKIECSQW